MPLSYIEIQQLLVSNRNSQKLIDALENSAVDMLAAIEHLQDRLADIRDTIALEEMNIEMNLMKLED